MATAKKKNPERNRLDRIKKRLGIDTIPDELTLSYQLKGPEVVDLLDFMASSGARNQSQAARQAMNAGIDLYHDVFVMLKNARSKAARRLSENIPGNRVDAERGRSSPRHAQQ